MDVPSRRAPLRLMLDAVVASWIVAVSLAAAAALGRQGVGWWVALGLYAVPLLVVSSLVGLVLPIFWRATEGVDLASQLSEKSLRALLAGPVVLVAWWTLGHLAVRLLAAFSERPASGGVLLGTVGVGIITFSTWLVERVARLLESRPIPPLVGYGGFVIVVLGGALISVLIGDTSGAGAPFALFGVFKRPELDLSAVAWLLGTALGSALSVSLWVARQARWWIDALGVVALVVSLLGVTAAGGMTFQTSLRVARGGGLAAMDLALLQALSDRDGDGASALFGGGDCNDRSASIHPAATEVYDNDIDENCDGLTQRPTAVEQKPVTDAAASSPERELPHGLNVLLLTVDTMRAELGFSGLAGTRSGISPHLDQLAARSTVFERAYSLASYTSKSLGPMLIGKYPSEIPRTFEHFDRFLAPATFVQERIQSAGIQTLSIQGYWYFFFKGYGFERGWDTLEHAAAPRVVAIEGDRTQNGDQVADDTIMYLKQLADRPARFFMWTHWVDPHAEYVPHEEHDFGRSERERYDGEVAFVDAQIGRVLAALEDSGLAETTMVVVTSDHGEAFGEHGMIRHGFEVWEELVHVPLLVHVPGIPPHRIGARRSLIDVAPTITEGLEMKVEQDAFSGQSLLADVLLAEGRTPAARPVLVDMPEGPHNRERRAFYVGDDKLIVSAGRVLGLYDLAADPAEKTDLSEDPVRLAPLRAAYDAFIAELDEVPPRK